MIKEGKILKKIKINAPLPFDFLEMADWAKGALETYSMDGIELPAGLLSGRCHVGATMLRLCPRAARIRDQPGNVILKDGFSDSPLIQGHCLNIYRQASAYSPVILIITEWGVYIPIVYFTNRTKGGSAKVDGSLKMAKLGKAEWESILRLWHINPRTNHGTPPLAVLSRNTDSKQTIWEAHSQTHISKKIKIWMQCIGLVSSERK